jgi:copper chaperone CopZ
MTESSNCRHGRQRLDIGEGGIEVDTGRGYRIFALLEELMDKLTLTIDGMSCGHCVARVKQTLAAAPGVHVDGVAIGSASLAYDATETTPDEIAAAVSNAGYPARVKSAGAPR